MSSYKNSKTIVGKNMSISEALSILKKHYDMLKKDYGEELPPTDPTLGGKPIMSDDIDGIDDVLDIDGIDDMLDIDGIDDVLDPELDYLLGDSKISDPYELYVGGDPDMDDETDDEIDVDPDMDDETDDEIDVDPDMDDETDDEIDEKFIIITKDESEEKTKLIEIIGGTPEDALTVVSGEDALEKVLDDFADD
mgnify:CR=1 FL=1